MGPQIRIGLGIISLIIEMGIGTLDFFALGVASIITGIIVYLNPNLVIDTTLISLIFGVLAIIFLIITRIFIRPNILKNTAQNSLMSQDTIIGQTLNVNFFNQKPVVFYDGIYWNIVGQKGENFVGGDIVKILNRSNGKLIVEKIS